MAILYIELLFFSGESLNPPLAIPPAPLLQPALRAGSPEPSPRSAFRHDPLEPVIASRPHGGTDLTVPGARGMCFPLRAHLCSAAVDAVARQVGARPSWGPLDAACSEIPGPIFRRPHLGVRAPGVRSDIPHAAAATLGDATAASAQVWGHDPTAPATGSSGSLIDTSTTNSTRPGSIRAEVGVCPARHQTEAPLNRTNHRAAAAPAIQARCRSPGAVVDTPRSTRP